MVMNRDSKDVRWQEFLESDLLKRALRADAKMTEAETDEVGGDLWDKMVDNDFVPRTRLCNNDLWKPDILRETLEPFMSLMRPQIIKEYHLGSDEPGWILLGSEKRYMAWPIHVTLQPGQALPPAIMYTLLVYHGIHGDRGYNPFFWEFEGADKPFRQDWANPVFLPPSNVRWIENKSEEPSFDYRTSRRWQDGGNRTPQLPPDDDISI